jgi:DNA-binding response OmpR family regulator
MAHVLIVDDDPAVGEILQLIFDQAGHAAAWAKSYQEMKDLLAERPYDLLFLDVRLPEKDGFQILHELKTVGGQYQQLPVVMLTNLTQLEEMDRAREIGALDYVIKSNIEFESFVRTAEQRWLLGTGITPRNG